MPQHVHTPAAGLPKQFLIEFKAVVTGKDWGDHFVSFCCMTVATSKCDGSLGSDS